MSTNITNNYNIIRSFESQFTQCANCNSKLQTFQLRTKRFKLNQQLLLRDNFKFNLNYFNEQHKPEHLVKSELELKFDFKNLIAFNEYANVNNYNELKIDLYLNGKLVNLLNFNSTLTGIRTKLARLQIHKINIMKLMLNSFNLKQEFKLSLILKVKFKTTTKAAKLNGKFKKISDFLVKNPVVIAYSRDFFINTSTPTVTNQNNAPLMTKFKQTTANQCGKKAFTISFREFGWDNVIIEPKYLSSFYCAGSCDLPLDDSLQPTNHAILISLASRLKRFNYLPSVCCKPAKLASRMFMFVDDHDNIVIKKIDNIIVESCSCQ